MQRVDGTGHSRACKGMDPCSTRTVWGFSALWDGRSGSWRGGAWPVRPPQIGQVDPFQNRPKNCTLLVAGLPSSLEILVLQLYVANPGTGVRQDPEGVYTTVVGDETLRQLEECRGRVVDVQLSSGRDRRSCDGTDQWMSGAECRVPCDGHLIGNRVPQGGKHLGTLTERRQAGVPREVSHFAVEPYEADPNASAAVVGVGDDAEVGYAGLALEVVFGVAFEEVAAKGIVVGVGDVTTYAVSLDDAAADVPDGFLGGVVGGTDGDASGHEYLRSTQAAGHAYGEAVDTVLSGHLFESPNLCSQSSDMVSVRPAMLLARPMPVQLRPGWQT